MFLDWDCLYFLLKFPCHHAKGFSVFPRNVLKGQFWSNLCVYPPWLLHENTQTPSWVVLWLYMCSHLCRTESFIRGVSSKHQTKVSKVAKRGLKPCNFDEIHLHDPTLSFSSGQGDIVDDTRSAKWGSECMSPCVVLWCLVIPLACYFPPLRSLLNSSTEAMDALCQRERERDMERHMGMA